MFGLLAADDLCLDNQRCSRSSRRQTTKGKIEEGKMDYTVSEFPKHMVINLLFRAFVLSGMWW